MKCFYHHDRDAVGTCKSCQRGLCPECAVDLDKGLACRSRCEQDVRGLIALIQNNVRLSPASTGLIQANRRGGINSAVFVLVLGAAFVVWGFTASYMRFISLLGAIYAVYGLISLVRALRITVPAAPPPEPPCPAE